MGGKQAKPAFNVHFQPEEAKDGTPPFRNIAFPLDMPLPTEKGGHLDTLLKLFEYTSP